MSIPIRRSGIAAMVIVKHASQAAGVPHPNKGLLVSLLADVADNLNQYPNASFI
jgi:hypothetical protein